MSRLRIVRDRAEDGITLVELIVYSVLLVFVLAIAGSILINALQTQREVRAVSTTSNSSQVVLRLFDRTLRNAATVDIPSVHGGTVLVAKTRVAEDGSLGSSWLCRAWHYDSASDELRIISGPATGTPVTAGLGTAVNSSGWHVALSGVLPTPSSPVFAAEGGDGAKIRFDIRTGIDSNRLSFASAAIPRPQGTTIGGVSCL